MFCSRGVGGYHTPLTPGRSGVRVSSRTLSFFGGGRGWSCFSLALSITWLRQVQQLLTACFTCMPCGRSILFALITNIAEASRQCSMVRPSVPLNRLRFMSHTDRLPALHTVRANCSPLTCFCTVPSDKPLWMVNF